MSEDATWKAVSTLEWKKKQKASAEPKGFGAILGEAADAVADKWNATGNLVPTYLKRMTEIQLQDESYIHQQLVKPEEAKPKRGLNRLISGGKGKAGRGIRLLKPSGSRKVRFGDDPHCKAAAGSLKAEAVGSINSASSSTRFAANASSLASKGSSYNKRATAGAGGLKSRTRLPVAEDAKAADDEATTVVAQPSIPAFTPAGTQVPAAAAASATTGLNSSSPTSKGSSRPQSPAAPAQQQQQPLFCPMPSKQSSGSGQLPRQPSSTSTTAPVPNSHRNSSNGAHGALGIMSAFLQQQSMQQPPETPSFAAGSLSGNWAGSCSGQWDEAPSKTELVDKQLQRLRISMALPVLDEPQQQQQGPASPLGYRPLAIPEELFERWSSVAGGGSSSSSTSALSARRASMDAPAGAGSAGSRASRRSSNSNIANSHGEAAQAGTSQMARSNSRDSSRHLQSGGSARDVDTMAVASGSNGGGGGISNQYSSRSVGDAAISSKQWRTSDYMTALGNIEASLHPRQIGISPSCSTTAGAVSPQQHPSSPRGGRHSSSGRKATRSGSGGCTAGTAARPQRSNSSTLPDVGELQLQRAPSPAKPLGAGGRSSRPTSNPRGNKVSIDVHNVPASGAAVSASSARTNQGCIGSPPASGGSSSNGNSSSETQTQHRLSGTTAPGDTADPARKNGGGIVHLPDIGRHTAKHQPQTQLPGLGRHRK